jgi:diadenosine tetraphosphate (Ap4A) HIT family hydrolase
MSTPFELHPKLAADTTWIGDLNLCRILLMEDARFPWLILVPTISGLKEFHEVPKAKQLVLMEEIERVSVALQTITQAYKLNVAALGNQVSQLHIHIIARQMGDPAWPNPVWGYGTSQPYTDKPRVALQTRLQTLLDDLLITRAAE